MKWAVETKIPFVQYVNRNNKVYSVVKMSTNYKNKWNESKKKNLKYLIQSNGKITQKNKRQYH